MQYMCNYACNSTSPSVAVSLSQNTSITIDNLLTDTNKVSFEESKNVSANLPTYVDSTHTYVCSYVRMYCGTNNCYSKNLCILK